MKLSFNSPRTTLYLEDGVKDRAQVLCAYHSEELKGRFGHASFSSLVRKFVIDEYKRMKREIEKQPGRATK